jgi:RNA polymerase sigma-70 factor, ECF subfamily
MVFEVDTRVMPDTANSERFPELYRELRAIAARHLRNRNSGNTLQPTALVHEAYLKISRAGFAANDTMHLLCAASAAMRQILVDHARFRARQKHGGGRIHPLLAEDSELGVAPAIDVLFVHQALTRLAELDTRQAKIVELKFFGGLTSQEIAAALNLSTKTVQRDWDMARAWLQRELKSTRDQCE